MSTDKMRADFEAWAGSPEFGLSPAHFVLGEDGEYKNFAAINYWLCFKAGRASAVVELPPIEAWNNDGYLERERDDEAESNMALVALVDVRFAMEKAGVTVK